MLLSTIEKQADILGQNNASIPNALCSHFSSVTITKQLREFHLPVDKKYCISLSYSSASTYWYFVRSQPKGQ